MKKIFLFLTMLFGSAKMEAQQNTPRAAGEYYLHGVMETAAGFKLDADSTFQFFFSYGALDRSGSGRWEQQGDKVVLNSTSGKGKNYSLVKSDSVADAGLMIKIIDDNAIFRSNVYGLIVSGEKQTQAKTNSNGEMSLPKQEVDSIMLFFEFCPEKTFVFYNPNKAHNYFEFKFENDILEVSFDHLTLTLDAEGMEGPLPLLKPGNYHFRRNKKSGD